jgi:hypothetical protein
MPVLSVVLFLLAILAGSLPAFSRTCCYPARFEPSPPYASNGCVCVVDDGSRLIFVYDPFDPYFYYQYYFCYANLGSCENVSFDCQVSDSGSITCSLSSSGDNPSGDNPSLPFPDFGGSGSGSGSGFACQSVNNLIDTFKGVKEGFLKVFIGSSFAFGLLGGAYAVLRVVF